MAVGMAVEGFGARRPKNTASPLHRLFKKDSSIVAPEQKIVNQMCQIVHLFPGCAGEGKNRAEILGKSTFSPLISC